MSAPVLSAASLLSAPMLGQIKKKRVLLIDTSQTKRELRAEVMRKLGMDVDSAADIAEARSWWRAALYDLVLISMEKGQGYRDKFCDDVRSATPPQRLAFLVGQPGYLANSPSAEDELPLQNADGQSDAQSDLQMMGKLRVALSDHGDMNQRWGILEASRRISAVRSASLARTQAMRALPAPPRDYEGRPPKSTATRSTLDDLLREELQ